MLIDLHTHTSEYSACSKADPGSLIEAAAARGLGGIVLTEHNYLRAPEEMDKLRKKFPQIKIFNAIEVSIKEDEHVLAYGVSNPELFYYAMPLSELERIVREQNGIMVLAHPFRYKDRIMDEVIDSGIEGIEIASKNTKNYMKKGYDYILSKKDLIKVMGSDSHSAETVGYFATDFKADIEDEAGLAGAIRSKEFTLYKNGEAIDELNETIAKKIPLALELIAQGLPDKEIREAVGDLTYSDIVTLRTGGDIFYDRGAPAIFK